MYWFIILCLLLTILYVFGCKEEKNKEYFGNESNPVDQINRTGEDNRITKNYSIFNDDLFSDVEVFDSVIEGNTVKEVGIENCLNKCDGSCVEFGYSGRGICFPDR